MSLTTHRLSTIAKEVLRLASAQGATQTEVKVTEGSGYSASVRMQTPETAEYHQDLGVSITVYKDHCRGSVSTSRTDPETLKTAVEAACRIATFTEADPCSGLADAELMATHFDDLDLYHPWNLSVENAIQLALRCENIALQHDKRIINSEGVSISTYQYHSVYANSHGFIGEQAETDHYIGCAMVAEAQGSMEQDDDYTVARDAKYLDDIETLAKRAVTRTCARLGAKRIKTGHMPILFEASVATSIISHFLSAINGYALYQHASFLMDHLDKQIFPNALHIVERPHILGGLASSVFDADGVATYDKPFIEAGCLKNYVLDYYSACQLNRKTTGNAGGVHNILVQHDGGRESLSHLLKQMDTGLFVTDLIGQGVNLVTGDYSRGVFGFWVEGGEIRYPVSEVTIAGNLRDIFLNIQAIGNDIDRRHSIQTGSILVDHMTVGGL